MSGKPTESPCLYCGVPVAQKTGPGRVKRYCTEWHASRYRNQYAHYFAPLGR
jgi:hypothetical protein